MGFTEDYIDTWNAGRGAVRRAILRQRPLHDVTMRLTYPARTRSDG